MNSADSAAMQEKLSKFRVLEIRLANVRALLDAITRGDPDGPCGNGPFTSNTRESRRIKSLQIEFTETRGGAPPVSMFLDLLFIEASDLKELLYKHLQKEGQSIQTAMEAL